ncbi:hypothetical protein SMACR_01658 [Sordaria macrospora]|uniref:WGS project CABT00000000 data, contig 2.5 n=2 Tax=Sordaria macrospora TaxID=5147 RepID=F7VRH3_SORMK|nr:uncharacterized protein SMAC_01658 [Sordaria macrospora k-hell]KAA8635935.1 hypothetical protein SMACR_01658 [Sordaria macrospora]WPJ61353.1 hypothetical protein SMAC4_01658 [Sordaria macrospora]CCC08108.1 unnamed protein product [Sordaria macrospora k-hell]
MDKHVTNRSLRQYCTLTSPYYTCTTILLGTTSLTTFPFSVLWEKEFPVGITGGLEKLAPGGGITAALINTATNSTETPFLDGFGTALSLTTINLSTRPTVMPLHFPIVTKDAKDKDIHWGASLAYVSSDVQYSDVSAYIVNCIEPKKAVLKECGSFFYGGITVKTGPTYYGYGFMYAIDSDMHTKECHCIHPLSPGELKNGKDDIGVCTSIWGPTGAPTTKVSTRVTSISASLANTTPVTVTSGVWVGPIETAETKEGGAAGRLDPPGRGMGMGMGLGGDVGAVLMAVVVGGLVGVLGVVL